MLLEAEREEALRRFRLALPAVLPPPDRERPALTSALVSFARRVLVHAGRCDTPSGPVRPFLPPAAEVAPHHLVAAVGLLYECVLIEMMECATRSGDTAPRRTLAAVQELADALRATGVAFWRGDDGWSESRRLARRLHDELGSTLAVALHRIELGEDDPAGAAAHLAVARKALTDALAENRGLIAGLRRSTRTPPLRPALETFLADLGPVPAVVRLPAGKVSTVRTAADVFLDSLGNGNTLRSYGIGHSGLTHLGEAGASLPMLMAKSRHKSSPGRGVQRLPRTHLPHPGHRSAPLRLARPGPTTS
ncbi:histidine kinase [Streptomyces sp. NBC_00078]|uniref:histidine kinase n=1 Tax=unclassified Streptomyces TaxID=2593676 RepID=UPI00225789D3|nr:histidine kinase [Streptomyces sp. NBC_00078]MCX5422628.1 histidine kinase dimerization/phosphoacceptor domain-containing protein [Streptomyces sp. NBC_00078]